MRVPEHDAAGIYKAVAAQQNAHTAKLVLLAVVVSYCLVGREIITIHSPEWNVSVIYQAEIPQIVIINTAGSAVAVVVS
jgi:hypothetical protein